MRRATIYTLDQSMFAGGIGIELARTWENEIDNWGTCESPLKFGGVGRPCHDLPYLPRTPREPIMPSRVKSCQLACHLPDVQPSVPETCGELLFMLARVGWSRGSCPRQYRRSFRLFETPRVIPFLAASNH